MNKKSFNKNKVVTVRLTDEQYAFLEDWKKHMEEKMDMEIPMGALIRRTIDKHIHDYKSGKFSGLSEKEAEQRLKKAKQFVENYNNEE